MESVVEDIRAGFEERDRLKRAAAVELATKATTVCETALPFGAHLCSQWGLIPVFLSLTV
jgi:hypothetical protein